MILFIAIFMIPTNLQSADKEYGEYLSSECKACHTSSKASSSGIPPLNGKSFNYIVTALEEFKDKKRASPIMHMIAKALDKEQIKALAAYFSSQK